MLVKKHKKAIDLMRHFLQLESAGGYLLIAATVLALIMANIPTALRAYDWFLGMHLTITVGGLGVGYTFGASVAKLSGTITNFKKLSDISGTYTSAGASGAYVVGVAGVTLNNSKGVIINVAGPEAGLEISLNLSGMKIRFK